MATSSTKATINIHPPQIALQNSLKLLQKYIKPVPARDNAKKTDWFIHLWIWITQPALFCVSSANKEKKKGGIE